MPSSMHAIAPDGAPLQARSRALASALAVHYAKLASPWIRSQPGLGDKLCAAFPKGSLVYLTRSTTALLALAWLAGCTSLSDVPPAGLDLSGEWVVDEAASDPPPDVDAIRRREDRRIARGRQTDPTASGAFVAQDFPVLAATRLVIEQDRDSMGVYYFRGDDSNYFDFTWGKRERDFWQVRTGWQEGELVILSERGVVEGTERLRLEDDGRRLRVSVSVDTGGEKVRSERVFDRR